MNNTGVNKSSNTIAIAVSGLSHAYNRHTQPRPIIKHLDLTVKCQESVAVVGRSGSGKSTLLNIIGALEPVQSGDVSVLGNTLTGLNDSERTALRRHHIGYIYQSFNLIPTLNVADNITLPLALIGVKTSQRTAALLPLLDAIGLSGRSEDYPDVLSGGEQQRVAIARALIHQPALVLADEPTGNLDAQSGRVILGLLNELVTNQGSSLVIVTHSLEVASQANRTLIMRGGQLDEVDPSPVNGSFAW